MFFLYFHILTSFCSDSEWARSSTISLCVMKPTNATASQPSKDWHIGRARAGSHVHQRCPAVFIQMALQTCIGLNRPWRDEERSKLFYRFNNSIHVWRSGWGKKKSRIKKRNYLIEISASPFKIHPCSHGPCAQWTHNFPTHDWKTGSATTPAANCITQLSRARVVAGKPEKKWNLTLEVFFFVWLLSLSARLLRYVAKLHGMDRRERRKERWWWGGGGLREAREQGYAPLCVPLLVARERERERKKKNCARCHRLAMTFCFHLHFKAPNPLPHS